MKVVELKTRACLPPLMVCSKAVEREGSVVTLHLDPRFTKTSAVTATDQNHQSFCSWNVLQLHLVWWRNIVEWTRPLSDY